MAEDDTPIEEPVGDTLEADLAKAFKENEGEKPEDAGEAEDEQKESSEEQSSAEKEEDASAEDKESEQGQDEESSESEDEDAERADPDADKDDGGDEELEAPHHWAAKDRQVFEKQSPEAKKFLLDRHKAMEADYTRKSQEVASIRRKHEDLDEVLSPFREEASRAGLDDVGMVRRLVSAHSYLERDPVNAINYLVEQYRIDPSEIVTQLAGANGLDLTQLSQAPQPDPTVVKLQRELNDLKTRGDQEASAKQREQYESHLKQVEAFATETDEKGNPKHPYFDEVADDIKAFVSQGASLEDAYDRAVYANPDVRKRILAEQKKAEQAEAKKRQAEKAKQAKQTGFDVSGEGAASPGEQQFDNVEDELRSHFAAGRV